jgi:hypothetical protein
MNKNLIIFFFMILILFTITTMTPRTFINDLPGMDFAHIYIFLILSYSLSFLKIIHVKYIYLILFSYGFLIEILQLKVGRDFSYLDILHNLIGISLGISFYFFDKKNVVLKYFKLIKNIFIK